MMSLVVLGALIYLAIGFVIVADASELAGRTPGPWLVWFVIAGWPVLWLFLWWGKRCQRR